MELYAGLLDWVEQFVWGLASDLWPVAVVGLVASMTWRVIVRAFGMRW